MGRRSNYDKSPYVSAGPAEECSVGRQAIVDRLSPILEKSRALCVECYPGVHVQQLRKGLRVHLSLARIFLSEDCLKNPEELRSLLNPLLGLAIAHLNRARILDDMRRDREAGDEFALAARLAPGNPGCYFY